MQCETRLEMKAGMMQRNLTTKTLWQVEQQTADWDAMKREEMKMEATVPMHGKTKQWEFVCWAHQEAQGPPLTRTAFTLLRWRSGNLWLPTRHSSSMCVKDTKDSQNFDTSHHRVL